jgi:predicted metalloprotease with PDZ domain
MVAKTLNDIAPHDWAGFLTQRLTEKQKGAPLAGFTASGYKLIYTDKPTPAFEDAQRTGKSNNLAYSGGLVLGTNGAIEQVIWDSAAFNAGLTVGDTLIAVNDKPFSDDLLKTEITAAKGKTLPIRLLVKTADRLRMVDLAWNDGLRYPRFEKIGTGESALDKLLEPRP